MDFVSEMGQRFLLPRTGVWQTPSCGWGRAGGLSTPSSQYSSIAQADTFIVHFPKSCFPNLHAIVRIIYEKTKDEFP